jgi:hypothetical protein
LQHNNLASSAYKDLLSAHIPRLVVKLLSHQKDSEWSEVGTLDTNAEVDIYSFPSNWRSDASRQATFLQEQDELTGRLKTLLSARTKSAPGILLLLH